VKLGLPEKSKLAVYFLEIYIFGPFWEGVSGEIKT
jgi:hypothetical protein